MKRSKRKNKLKSKVSDLAALFEKEMNTHIDITILPNDKGVRYKQHFLITEMPNHNWGLIDLRSKDCIDEFYLKSSALMGAKAYSQTLLNRYEEIKTVDRNYWASQLDILMYRNILKTVKEFDRYLILLDKLEYSKNKHDQYKLKISKMFRWAFV